MTFSFKPHFYNFDCILQELKSRSWGLLNLFNFKSEVHERVFVLNPNPADSDSKILFLLNEKILKKIDMIRTENSIKPDVFYY